MSFLWKKEILNSEKNKGRFKRKIKGFFEKTKTEVKNSILFDGVNCPHFNYVGDSVLGESAHTGAGVILSNVRSDKMNVKVEKIETNLRKMGAIVGSNAEIGCNSVVCTGTIIGNNTSIYPLTMVKGVIPSNSIVKSTNEIVLKK